MTANTPPDPSQAGDLGEFIAVLRELRHWAGGPSYRMLAKRVGALMRPPQFVAHSTVSNVFLPQRRRLDIDLVTTVARALGVEEPEVARWRQACVRVHAALRRHVGVGRVAADDPAVARIAELCGHLPLALRVTAANLAHRHTWTTDHMEMRLRAGLADLAAFDDGDRQVRAAFDLSHRHLTRDQQAAFRHLGLIPGPDADVYAVAALLDAGLNEADTAPRPDRPRSAQRDRPRPLPPARPAPGVRPRPRRRRGIRRAARDGRGAPTALLRSRRTHRLGSDRTPAAAAHPRPRTRPRPRRDGR